MKQLHYAIGLLVLIGGLYLWRGDLKSMNDPVDISSEEMEVDYDLVETPTYGYSEELEPGQPSDEEYESETLEYGE